MLCHGAWNQARTGQRIWTHLIAQLVCLGRHTLTAIICTRGRLWQDWTADYRLYTRRRVNVEEMFKVVLDQVKSMLKKDQPLVVGMDDSILRKRGPKISGVGWRRDPLGPPFSLNWIRAQRVLQLSAALPYGSEGQARMIPIAFAQAPTASKPKHNASSEDWEQYHREQKQRNINQVGARHLKELAESLENDRSLWVVVDGRFTNRTLLSHRPVQAVLIGRIRSDAKLYKRPESNRGVGRRRLYGEEVPTPEELRQDTGIPWQRVPVYAAGRVHWFKIKTFSPLRWRAAGRQTNLQLIVVAPLGYKLRKNSRMLYRKPAYLICTDAQLPAQHVLQSFVWRWDLEVNFRDEKTLLGVGQAQVRQERAVESVPALSVAAYALLLLSSIKAFGPAGSPDDLPVPLWRKNKPPARASTCRLINQLRWELWSQALAEDHFSGFWTSSSRVHNPQQSLCPLHSALFYSSA